MDDNPYESPHTAGEPPVRQPRKLTRRLVEWLPPAYTVDTGSRPLHSWRTPILPFIEQKSLYEKIDLSKPWGDPANLEAYETASDAYQCPSVVCPPNHTTYFAVMDPVGSFRPTEPRKLSELPRSTSSTLMVMEVGGEHAVHWMSPTDPIERWLLELDTVAKTPHPGGAQAALVDRSIDIASTEQAQRFSRRVYSPCLRGLEL